MARARSADRPRTPFTDNNGGVLEQYRSGFCISALEFARNAGIPDELLHPSGWAGDESNTAGLFSAYVYTMADFVATGETDMQRIERTVIKPLVNLCGNVGVDWREAMEGVLNGARYLRFLSVQRSREAIFARGETVPLSEDDEAFYGALDLLGAPSGPEHDSHGHGYSMGRWHCQGEES